MADLRLASADATFPAVVLVHPASVEAGDDFFSKRWPTARAIADTEHVLFNAFRRRRGGLRELLAPRVWLAGLRAMRRGHFAGLPQGDALLLPGMFLVHGGQILWEHDYRHPGDRPDLRAVAELARATR